MNRFRKIIFAFIAFVTLASLGYVSYGFWANATAEARFRVRVEERQKAGLPSQLVDLNGKNVPDEQNVAAQLAKIADSVKDLHSRLDEYLPKEAIPNRYLTDAELTQISPLLRDRNDLLNQLIAISKLPSFYSPIPKEVQFSDLIEDPISPDLTNLSLTSDLLRTRALHAHSANQLNEALQAIYAALALGNLANNAPTSDGFLIFTRETSHNLKTLNLILQQSPLSDSQVAELKTNLGKIQTVKALRKALTSDSAAYATGLLEQKGALSWFNRGRVYSALIYHFDMYDEFVQNCELPLEQWETKYAGFDTPFSWNPFINVVNLNRANNLAFKTISVRVDILKQCVYILAKIQQQVASNSTDITLDGLGLSPEDLQDPYTMKPLQLQGSAETGWFIYSVSANRQDDGGNFENSQDHGIGPSPKSE